MGKNLFEHGRLYMQQRHSIIIFLYGCALLLTMVDDGLIGKLHPLERKVLPALTKSSDFDQIVKETGLKDVEVMRALQWLQNKKLVGLETHYTKAVIIGNEGKNCAKTGLPERHVLNALKTGPCSLDELKKKTKLSQQEISAAIGFLKRNVAIEFGKEINLTEQGQKLALGKTREEQFLEKLSQGNLDQENLDELEKHILIGLQKRKGLVEVKPLRSVTAILTTDGKKIASSKKLNLDVLDRVTPEMLSSGAWNKKEFRQYDVTINVPKITAGRRHFARQSIDYAKRIWLELGFKEMTGPMVQTSFWVFDALFTAQDHPVREMQDTFFMKKPATGKLPDKKLIKAIKDVHEHGGDLGSTGWGGTWDEKNASTIVPRTHTTCLSAQTLSQLKEEDMPGKYFAVGRCFRNETLDWCHLFEFNQTEGIVIDPKANFKHLLGYLNIFFKKMGFEKVRFRPAFFAYTEPSVEIDVYHPYHKKWVELGGAGVLRPEVVVPLIGKDVPVLAWGPGFDRVALEYFGITDIRDLYKNDLKQIREMKMWMK